MEEFRESVVVRSFVNVEGFFERNENVARIGAMINKKRHRDGISHTKFITPNGSKIHIESRARFVSGKIAYEHIVRSIGKSTHITRDRIVVLDIIREYGGYHDTYRYQGQRNIKNQPFGQTSVIMNSNPLPKSKPSYLPSISLEKVAEMLAMAKTEIKEVEKIIEKVETATVPLVKPVANTSIKSDNIFTKLQKLPFVNFSKPQYQVLFA